MSWKAVSRRLADLEQRAPHPKSPEDQAELRLQNLVLASGDPDLVAFMQALYLPSLEDNDVDIEALIDPDPSAATTEIDWAGVKFHRQGRGFPRKTLERYFQLVAEAGFESPDRNAPVVNKSTCPVLLISDLPAL